MHTLIIEARIIKRFEVNQAFFFVTLYDKVCCVPICSFSNSQEFEMMSDMELQVLKVARLEGINASVIN